MDLNNLKEDKDNNEKFGVIDVALLDCTICLNMLVEPISVPCGHTFCRTCLVAAQQRAQKKCPVCRAVCVIDATAQKENVQLASILKTCFPKQYAERLKEVEETKKTWKQNLPIFFFNDTLFPGGVLKLHLFEERYKLMIKRVLEGNRKFVYLPNFTNYKASKGDVGVVAEVLECRFLHDGRALLQARIVERAVVADSWVEDGTGNLAYCQYELFKDEPENDDQLQELLVTANLSLERFKGFVQRLEPIRQFTLKEQLGGFPEERSTPEAISWWLINTLSRFDGMSTSTKVALLKSNSFKWRLQTINTLFNDLLSALEQ